MIQISVFSGMAAALGTLVIYQFTKSLWSIAFGLLLFALLFLLGRRRYIEQISAEAQEEIANEPMLRIAEITQYAQDLEALQQKVEDETVRGQITPIIERLHLMSDYLQENPSRVYRLKGLTSHLLPTLKNATYNHHKAEKYGFVQTEKFSGFLKEMSCALDEMHRQLFMDGQMAIDVDMHVAMNLLEETGYNTEKEGSKQGGAV